MESKIFFQPFVGKDYANGGIFGKRILVLGESHYMNEENREDCMVPTFTQDIVEWYLDENKERKPWMPTYLKFERSLVGEETDQEERLKIWNSIMFYNYLQVPMYGPREAGTDEQYQQSENAFFEVLEKYRPEYVIAWGKRLWEKLPGDKEGYKEGKDIKVGDTCVPTGSYTLKSGHRVKVMAVNHPSVGYSWDYWHRVIKEFLN